MKRVFSFFVSASIPLSVLLVLTAGAARVYAEAGVPILCGSPEVVACATKATGDPCTLDGGSGTCEPTGCFEPDGGLTANTQRCVESVVVPEGGSEASADASGDGAIPEAGSDAGSSGGDSGFVADASGDARGALDGSTNGGAPASNGGGGCSLVAGASHGGALRTGAGLLLALGALLRVGRRARTKLPPRA